MTIAELKSNVKWWESKRWIFNIAVLISGVFAIYIGLSQCEYYWSLEDTFGVVLWVIGANIFYSLGILLELFDWYYLKNKIGIVKFRLFFFVIGTLFSCLWTFFYNWAYFIGHIW